MAKTAAPNAIPTLAMFLAPKPVIGGAVIVGLEEPEEPEEPDELEELLPVVELPDIVKLAHVMRVVFAKWTVMERLPKNAPIPGRVEAYKSV